MLFIEANECVRVEGEFSEFCGGGGCEAGVCDVLFNIFMDGCGL